MNATASAASILVVDDEKNIRRTLQLVLEGEGYRVIGAETAEHAIEILASPNTPVDLAIFDVKLPGMSGLDALERVRKEEATRDTPITTSTRAIRSRCFVTSSGCPSL